MDRSSRKPDEPALVTALFSRRLAEPFARLAVRLGISADAVMGKGYFRLTAFSSYENTLKAVKRFEKYL